LAPRNDTVSSFNDLIIGSMVGELREYHANDTWIKPPNFDPSTDSEPPNTLLRSLDAGGLPPSTLKLKVGAPVMLLRNFSPRTGLCNGTRLSVTRLMDNCIEGRILGGAFHSQTRFLPRIKVVPQKDESPFEFSRVQFPIRLCFAMTINKSQGQTFSYVAVDLRTSVFSHGQLYVAMSRATDVSRVSLLLPEIGPTLLSNVVWPELLLSYPVPILT
jgi:hypothetical protein